MKASRRDWVTLPDLGPRGGFPLAWESPGNKAAQPWHVGILLCSEREQASSPEMGVGVERDCARQDPGHLGPSLACYLSALDFWVGQPFLTSVSPYVKWEWVDYSRLSEALLCIVAEGAELWGGTGQGP